ncbi:hypothetical protein [Aureimonas sp. ME7]|uniref:hypothetical protein n=1 Tax=Aureimonas sp. ME7 TaxID=2744252 RepID=UPI0015F98C6B|nr:hypothetical protein [Aureimonas sp. ME7]
MLGEEGLATGIAILAALLQLFDAPVCKLHLILGQRNLHSEEGVALLRSSGTAKMAAILATPLFERISTSRAEVTVDCDVLQILCLSLVPSGANGSEPAQRLGDSHIRGGIGIRPAPPLLN